MARRRTVWLAAIVVVIVGAIVAVRWRQHRDRVEPVEAERDVVVSKTRASTSRAAVALKQPARTLRLEGQVIDEQDKPVAGADISNFPDPRNVISESDGSFAFDGLVAGHYEVSAYRGELYAHGSVRLTATSEPLVLHMRRGTTLILHVVDDHASLEGARVGLDARPTVSTDPTGTATIAGVNPDMHFVVITAAGHGPAMLTINVGDDPGSTIERTVKLRRGAPVSGVVVGPDGKPVADAEVEVNAVGVLIPSRVTSDAAGAWNLDALAAGKYLVRASSKMFGPTSDLELKLDGTTPRRDVVVRLAYDAQLVGTVVDANGMPVADALVIAEMPPHGFHARSSSDGRFEMFGLLAGTYQVEASSSSQGSTTSHVTIGNNERVEVRLTLESTGISGTVVDVTGEPIAEARVTAAAPSIHGYGTDVTDSHGHFEIDNLSSGEYRIDANWPGQGPRSLDHGQLVRSGTRDVKLVLEAPASLVGRVLLDGAPMTSYSVLVSEHPDEILGMPAAVHAADGRFAIQRIAPGTCSVVVIAPGTARKAIADVNVEPGKPTDLGDIAMAHGQRISGHVRDAAGAPAPGAMVTIEPFHGHFDHGVVDSVGLALEGVFQTTTDDSGAYHFDGVSPLGTPRFPAQISATDPDRGTSLATNVPDGDATIDLTLVATGGIDGTVEGTFETASGVVRASSGSDRPRTTHVESDHSFSFDALPPGDYTISITIEMGKVGATPVTVAVQANRRSSVTLVVPRGSVTLTVTITGDPCKMAMLLAGDGPPKSTDTSAVALCSDNVAEFDNVQPGNYRVCTNGPSCAPITVTATPDHQTAVAHVGSGA